MKSIYVAQTDLLFILTENSPNPGDLRLGTACNYEMFISGNNHNYFILVHCQSPLQ